jgi:hypothetical protein
MNKLIALCGLVMLSTASTPQEGYNELECDNQEVEVIMTSTEERYPVISSAGNSISTQAPKLVTRVVRETPVELPLDEIVYIEEEAEIDLGFDTAEYLPEGFDPNKQYVDLNSIEFIEEVEIADLGFDTTAYLPESFNPYAAPTDVMNIDYIEEGEDTIDLGFDTKEYLPDGFDPHELYVDLNAIEYIEEDVWKIEIPRPDLGI